MPNQKIDFNSKYKLTELQGFRHPNDLNSIAEMTKFCLINDSKDVFIMKVITQEVDGQYHGFEIQRRQTQTKPGIWKSYLYYGADFRITKESLLKFYKGWSIASFDLSMQKINF